MKLTTASKITVLRIFLIPVVVALMYLDFTGHMYAALAVFVAASLSDFVDGYIARHYHQVSNFQKILQRSRRTDTYNRFHSVKVE